MSDEQSKFAPALAGYGSGLWSAFVSNNGSNTLLVAGDDGAGWAPHAVVNGASKCAPALATVDDKLWMAFVANNDSNMLLLISSRDGVHWIREKPPNESSKCSLALAGSYGTGLSNTPRSRRGCTCRSSLTTTPAICW